MDRRSFLLSLSQFSLMASVPGTVLTGCANTIGWGTVLGGGRFAIQDPVSKSQQVQQAFVIVKEQKPELVYLDFLPHGIALDPNNPNRVFTFEKIGHGACEIDLANQQMVRSIPAGKGRLFYGHGAASPQGDLLYCTETVLSSSAGVIAVRDLNNLDLLGEFPSYGHAPHDCHLIDDGRVMAITNGGGTKESGFKPSVAFVDVQSQQLLQQFYLTNEALNTGHLAMGNRQMAVVSAPRHGLSPEHLGGVSLWDGERPLRSMSEPQALLQQLQGEALSVALVESEGIAVATHPDANLLTFWDLENQTFRGELSLPKPRGITLDANQDLIVSYGQFTRLQKIDIKTLSLKEGFIDYSYISGSHVYQWEKEKRFSQYDLSIS